MNEIITEIKNHPELNYMAPTTQLRLIQELEVVSKKAVEAEKMLGQTFDSAQDWHDNFAYENQQREVQRLYKKQTELKGKLKDVVLLKPNEITDVVDVGHTVQVLFENEKEPETYTILGKEDTHTQKNWISYLAPLAQALMGTTPDSVVEIKLPENRTTSVKLLSILVGQF